MGHGDIGTELVDALDLVPHRAAAVDRVEDALVAGFPFVKRTAFEDSRFAEQRDAIALFIRQEFGVDLT